MLFYLLWVDHDRAVRPWMSLANDDWSNIPWLGQRRAELAA